MSQTVVPTPAPNSSLTFAKEGSSSASPNIVEVIDHEEIYQLNGSLTLIVSLKLHTPAVTGAVPINHQTSFVNVMVFSKINGVAKVFEIRRTREEMELLMALLPTDPKSDEFLKRTNGIITHMKFRFDNVLVLPPATPTNPFPILPSENIVVTAYEQNNGKTESSRKK